MAPDRATPDEELMRRVQQGDERAFETLFERHAGLLRVNLLRRLTPAIQRKVSIADILQETRIVAIGRCKDFEPRGPNAVRKWFDRIAELKANEMMRKFRRQKRRVQNEVTRGARDDTANFLAKGPSPSQAAIANETAESVRAAFASLSPDYQLVLRVAREEDLKLVRAAERIGRSHEATKKLYARALRRLAAILAEASDG